MPHIFGRNYTRDELRQLTGTLKQVAGVQRLELADGKPRGLRVADVYTGSGFRFQIWLDRAMDIGGAEYMGRPLAWLHPALGAPAQYEPQAAGWLRTFGGGLLTTCGLTQIGAPVVDEDEALGLHGRISHMPAEKICVSEEWCADDYMLVVAGQVRQAVLFGENLLFTRKISTRLGANHLVVEDCVRNDGFRATPHMILYHCNFGFPVVSPNSELLIHDESVAPRDTMAQRGLSAHTHFDPPAAVYAEQVFFHQPQVDTEGFARAAIVNRALNFGAYMRYRAAELPYLWQWKMMGAGEYVCALEPANHMGAPRNQLRRSGHLRLIEPGEEIRYHVEIGALTDADAIQKFEHAY